MVDVPRELLSAVAELRLPPPIDRRLQSLMDRNNEGTLMPDEREELAALAGLSEVMALMPSRALYLLGRGPG